MASASDLNAGNYFLHNNEPVQVVKKEVIAYGTNSHTKLKFYFKPLTGGGEKTVTMGHIDKVDILDITRKSGMIIAKMQDKVQIMDSQSYETFDAKIDPDLLESMNENDEVIFVDYQGNAQVLEKKRKSGVF